MQSYVPQLVVALQDNLMTIGDQCLANGLISSDTYSSILGSSETKGDRARHLLDAVKNCIKTNSRGFWTLLDILHEVLPTASQALLGEMKQDVTDGLERQKVTECTDDGDHLPVHPTSRVEEVRPSMALPKTSRVSQGKSGIGGNGLSLHQPELPMANGAVQQPISATATDVARSTCTADLSSRRTMLKLAGEMIHAANMEAQQDEAEKQQLRDENAKLKEERDKLQKALKLEKQLKKQLEEMKDHLNDLVKRKLQREADLNRELELMQTRLSEVEVRGNVSRESYEKLQNKLSKDTLEYDAQIAAQERKIEKQKERLTRQETVIEEKEHAVCELIKQVKELIRENQNLVRSNSHKDEELVQKNEQLANEKSKSLDLQNQLDILERGFYCSRLAQLFSIWVMFIVLGILVVSVSIYKYMYPDNSCT